MMAWFDSPDGESEKDTGSQDITVESDADETAGQYSRDEAISFRASRERAQSSQEAREARGEDVEDSPLGEVDTVSDVAVEDADGDDGSASSSSSSESQDLSAVVREYLDNAGRVVSIASGVSSASEFELARMCIDGEWLYATIQSESSGVAFERDVERCGREVSISSVGVDVGKLATAVSSRRRRRKRETMYQPDVSVFGELSEDQQAELVDAYEMCVDELVESALMQGVSERNSRGVSVSVVDGCVVAWGSGVTSCVADALSGVVEDEQLRVLMDSSGYSIAFVDALRSEVESKSVRSEISRAASLSSECVVAGRLALE